MEQKKKQKERKAAMASTSEEPQEFKKPQEFKDKKATNATSSEEPQEFKKPQEFKEPQKFKKASDTKEQVSEDAPKAVVKEEAVEKPAVENTIEENFVKEKEEAIEKDPSAAEPTEELDTTLKRKASEGDLNEEDAKKHKSNEETPRESLPPPPVKKTFNPLPRAARSRRGKSLALHGSKSLGRQDVHQVKDPAVPDTPGKTNDDFRNMLLGKK